MKKTLKGQTAVGIQAGAAGAPAPQGIGKLSAIGAALSKLLRLRTGKKIAAQASAETEWVRRPGQEGMARSPMDAGISRGLSLLLENPNAPRKR